MTTSITGIETDSCTFRIDAQRIAGLMSAEAPQSPGRIREVLARARELRGLADFEVAALCAVSDGDLLEEVFESARAVKQAIYGDRMVLFAPLYISNLCQNECAYCAFRVRNQAILRRSLTPAEIAAETKSLVDQGHKRILLVAGEAYPRQGFDYILDAIETIYSVRSGRGEIRRINVNIAPLTVAEFRRLRQAKIGTYQLFQETYHEATYHKVHISGPKVDYGWRLGAIDRALEAGIDDVGIGVLFGLHDWRFEVLALLQHIQHLEQRFGVGPHTISVPRLEPADGSDLSQHPPAPVADLDFRKIVAVLRLAVPYTGIIMSTRETANLRRMTMALGVSQISAGSRTNPGGYAAGDDVETANRAAAQFSLGDHRSLDAVILNICEMGYIPSFCTACYRLGRTGQDFMDLAKPGQIKLHCQPNALSTLQEYALDYASPQTRRSCEAAIARSLEAMDPQLRRRCEQMLD
ncbi:MAG TPA: [FeFe] hydrogenase H-cluster radical SAM maturase HydG, partial [Firmicutes bacterium]|nr:[FeFe] hydrogenase H-cluster radical SAM maturase HydG [Bacillota bacterium]